MDNLTHSMLGAVLGQTGLKRKSGFGMAALIMGANLPDIDATCVFMGTESLAIRRGITHGPLALVLLPLLLTIVLYWFDRWQQERGTRPAGRLPVHFGWLYGLAFLGTLSHPALDWLNSYGIRLLEPFVSRWYYGDALFIIDAVLWAILIIGYIWSRRAEMKGNPIWRTRGRKVMVVAAGYIILNIGISAIAETLAAGRISKEVNRVPSLVVANPVPLAFWRRDMLWRSWDGRYGHYEFNILELVGLAPEATIDDSSYSGMEDPRVAGIVARSPDAQYFLFWSRMPLVRFRPDGTMVLTDQRFDSHLTRGNFTTIVPPRKPR